MMPASDPLPADLAQIKQIIQQAALARSEDCMALLQLLHTLEESHRAIQDREFRTALPSTRRALYTLLQDIEETGRWPYLPRTQIRSLLTNLRMADGRIPASPELEMEADPLDHDGK